MSHDHSHSLSPINNSSKNIAYAFVLNISFALIELVGGLLTNSVAILSDAVHDFGDSLSLGVAWYLQKFSQKRGDRFYSYGYKRFSLLGSIFISLVLAIGSVFIIQESVKRIIEPQQAHAPGMIILAVIGIIVNGAAVLRLKHGTSHNEKAVLLHMMEDVLGWIAVFIGAVLMFFFDLPFLDPLMSLIITAWVLWNVYRNLRNTVKIMLQEVPKSINVDELEGRLLSINEIVSLHDLHIWSLDGENHILTLHIVVADETDSLTICNLKERVREITSSSGIDHITIEVERTGEAHNCKYTNSCR
ncbi:MAG: cobalt transporter [Bacteroidetes bacterium GWE2_39_28]|nr:MAG: cobalt transporter [Bacteroidetes bacterium GWE2_39_28]OFY14088.1 MAG: cobalt transporter [Bacteroidetes bacterium GWF2_39_10]OFZ07044.1 MAG: cobalt transporter [Bacteroidetes bacterium RIFOXYB2_FULL_39_7]OFZ10874.1 MAG: cobalt transporter [Bacteroidetes bacterium RIFOXYC2_FULL_39_11]HCT94029.1 cation transporter [Rikenellaceae bacterium]